MSVDEHHKWMLHARGIETPCSYCRGFGTMTYGSTATWHGGMGGASMTKDVCYNCWGSGDENDHWTDLRKLRNEENARVAAKALVLLEQRCGVWLRSLLPAIDELCLELDKFERQRRKRPSGFDTVARCLASVLREMVAAMRAEIEKDRCLQKKS